MAKKVHIEHPERGEKYSLCKQSRKGLNGSIPSPVLTRLYDHWLELPVTRKCIRCGVMQMRILQE